MLRLAFVVVPRSGGGGPSGPWLLANPPRLPGTDFRTVRPLTPAHGPQKIRTLLLPLAVLRRVAGRHGRQPGQGLRARHRGKWAVQHIAAGFASGVVFGVPVVAKERTTSISLAPFHSCAIPRTVAPTDPI
jgi:hypothetical protein